MANDFPADQFSQILFKLFVQIRVVVVQVLAQPLQEGQPRVAIREWVIIDSALRDQLMMLDSYSAINQLKKVIEERGHSMAQQAKKAYDEGKISLASLRSIAGDAAGGVLAMLGNAS